MRRYRSGGVEQNPLFLLRAPRTDLLGRLCTVERVILLMSNVVSPNGATPLPFAALMRRVFRVSVTEVASNVVSFIGCNIIFYTRQYWN